MRDKRGRARVAIAAYAAAFGIPAPWPHPWGEPFRPLRGEHPVVQRSPRPGGRTGRRHSPPSCSTARPRRPRSCMRSTRATRSGRSGRREGAARPRTALAASCLRRARRFRGSRVLLGSPTRPPRSALGRSRTAGHYRVCPAQDHLLRLHLPKHERVQREPPCAGRRPCLAGGAAAGNPLLPLHRCGHPAPRPRLGRRGVAHHRGTGQPRPPDAREPRRAVPLHRAARSPRSAWSRRSRSTTPTRTSSSSPSPTCSTWRTAPGSGARLKTRQRPLRSRDGPVPRLPAARARGRAHGGERAPREAGWPDAHRAGAARPRRRRHASYRPERPGPGRRGPEAVHELAAPWHGDKVAAARPGKHCACCPVKPLVPGRASRREERHDAHGQGKPRTVPTARRSANGGDRDHALSRRQAPGDPVYEDRVQRAYNHLVLHCMRNGSEPPASVPDMVTWAARTSCGVARRPERRRDGRGRGPRGRRDAYPDASLPGVGDAVPDVRVGAV